MYCHWFCATPYTGKPRISTVAAVTRTRFYNDKLITLVVKLGMSYVYIIIIILSSIFHRQFSFSVPCKMLYITVPPSINVEQKIINLFFFPIKINRTQSFRRSRPRVRVVVKVAVRVAGRKWRSPDSLWALRRHKPRTPLRIHASCKIRPFRKNSYRRLDFRPVLFARVFFRQRNNHIWRCSRGRCIYI